MVAVVAHPMLSRMEAIGVMRKDEAVAERVAALDSLFATFGRSDAPGLVVGISAGELSYRRGFGLASVQHGIANSARTRVRIASITKQFTCLAVMLLAEDGVLAIDDPVSNYLPDLPGRLGRATLRQLMTHSSGWRCTLELGTIANGFAMQPADWQSRALRRQSLPQFPPGEGQLYCNGSYVALGAVIERCAGEGYAAFLKRRIFEPLSMHDTEVVADDLTMVPGMASAHVRATEGWSRPPADAEFGADGGIVSSLDDMLRWLAHLRGSKLFGSAATWRELLTPARLANGFETTYAMGVKRHSYRGVEVIQHSGGLFGLNAHAMTVPAHGLDIIIVVNGAPASATRLAFTAVDLVLADALTLPPAQRPQTKHYSFLLNWVFALPDGLLLTFADLGGTLGLSQMGMAPLPLIYEDEKTLFVVFEEIGFGPLSWSKVDLAAFDDDPVGGLPVTIAGYQHVLEGLSLLTGSERSFSAAGIYASDTLEAEAEFTSDQGAPALNLRGDYSGTRRFAVHGLTHRHFVIVSSDGAERYAIELDLERDGTTRGFWIDTHRARRVWFNRVRGDEA